MKDKILKSAYVGICFNLSFFIIIGVMKFIINREFLLNLGLENLGIMKVMLNLVSYINIAELGIYSAAAYALYDPIVKKDSLRLNIAVNTITFAYKIIVVAIFILSLIVAIFIPFILNGITMTREIYIYWALFVASNLLSYLYAYKITLISANGEYNFVIIVGNISVLISSILQLIAITKFGSFMLFIASNFISIIICQICYTKFIKSRFKIEKTDKKDVEIFKNLKFLVWHKLSYIVLVNTDIILISMFVSVKIAGVYGSFIMITGTLLSAIIIVRSILTPKVGRFIAASDKSEIYALFSKLNYLFISVACVVSVPLYFVIGDFVKIWLGSEIYLSNLTILLIMANFFISIFRLSIDIFKEASGFFSDIKLPISEALINLVLSLSLVFRYGLDGILIGTLVANFIIVLVAKPFLVYKVVFEKQVQTLIKDYTIAWLNCIAIVGISSFFICKLTFEISNYLEFTKVGVLYFMITLIISFLVLILNKNFRDLLRIL